MKTFSDKSSTVGYLGPPGTFTHQVVRSDTELGGRPHRSFPDVRSLVESVADGEVGRAVVAWDNSLIGPVGETLDLVAGACGRVQVQRDLVFPVRMCLWGRRGAGLRDLARVVSHPHALAQCAGWLRTRLPGAVTQPAPSTVAALAPVAADRTGHTGAIAPAAARPPDPAVVMLAEDIGDAPGSETRFMILSGQPRVADVTGRTLVVCFGLGGELRAVFDVFSRDGLAPVWMGVRPARRAVGDLNLLLECAGEPRLLRAALDELARRGIRTAVLGVLEGTAAGRPVVVAC